MTEEEGVGLGAALYSWGSNSEGALGLNDVSDRFSFYVMWIIHQKKTMQMYYFSVLSIGLVWFVCTNEGAEKGCVCMRWGFV